jgi:hypothetical protein
VSWIEVRDSTGRCERGSFEYAVNYARKWITTAFVAAHPDLTWLYAAAASMDGNAILLAGPAGAGKSTSLVQLVDRAWHLLADDVVALRPNCGEALPLPFSPEVRAAPRELEQDWSAFLAQPKALATIAPERVASKPAPVAAIVFPEYACDVTRPLITPLTVVAPRVGFGWLLELWIPVLPIHGQRMPRRSDKCAEHTYAPPPAGPAPCGAIGPRDHAAPIRQFLFDRLRNTRADSRASSGS